MAYDSIISRTDATSLIPIPVAQEIIKAMGDTSAALRLFKRVSMSSKTNKLPVLSALPTASWLSGQRERPAVDIVGVTGCVSDAADAGGLGADPA